MSSADKRVGHYFALFYRREQGLNADDYLTKEFYGIGRRIPKHGARRQTRQAASHVDFRVEPDLERIPEDENSRRKHRTKPQHCPSCLCQSYHENPAGNPRINDNPRCKNAEKVEAMLTQHLDYSTSRVASTAMRNVGRVGQSSPRNRPVQQRSQYHRPGTSVHHCQDCNNPVNSVTQRHSRKHADADELECPRLDSQFRDIVNYDLGTEDTDFQFPYQQVDTAKFGKLSNIRWHSPPGEPHLGVEINFPAEQRRGDCSQSKRRHSGQGESVDEDCREDKMRLWTETVLTDVGDDWQYERDKRELMELRDGVREYAKRRIAGCNKLHREEAERNDESLEALEKINRLVRKLPLPRQRNTAVVAARNSSVVHQPRKKSPIDQELRIGTSRIDARETCHSGTMDAANRRTSASRDREVERNLDEESFDVEPSSLRRATDGIKENDDEREEDEAGSETEEDARQLALKETETNRLEQKSMKLSDDSKSWGVGKKKKKKRVESSELNEENKEERDWEKSFLQRKRIDSRERCGGKKDKSANTCRESKPLTATMQSSYDLSDSEDEFTEENKINCRERAGGNKEIEENRYDGLKHNCYRGSRTAKDPELERNDTRKFIGEVIDNSLSRETERGSAGTLRETKKDFQNDAEVSDKVIPKRGTSEAASKFESDEFATKKFSYENERLAVGTTREDIIVESRNSREYAKELKNRRWRYLNNMQSELDKLFELEKHLDSCTPERHSSLPAVSADTSAVGRETNGPSQEQSKVR